MIQDQVTVLYIYPPLLEWGGEEGDAPVGTWSLVALKGSWVNKTFYQVFHLSADSWCWSYNSPMQAKATLAFMVSSLSCYDSLESPPPPAPASIPHFQKASKGFKLHLLYLWFQRDKIFELVGD